MLPALIAQMVIALKDSALGYQIGYVEVVRSGIQSASYNQNFLASLVVVAIIMILINWALTALAQRIERQLRAGRARRNIVAKVPTVANQGLDTKDNVNVDWHAPGYQQVRNPADRTSTPANSTSTIAMTFSARPGVVPTRGGPASRLRSATVPIVQSAPPPLPGKQRIRCSRDGQDSSVGDVTVPGVRCGLPVIPEWI